MCSNTTCISTKTSSSYPWEKLIPRMTKVVYIYEQSCNYLHSTSVLLVWLSDQWSTHTHMNIPSKVTQLPKWQYHLLFTMHSRLITTPFSAKFDLRCEFDLWWVLISKTRWPTNISQIAYNVAKLLGGPSSFLLFFCCNCVYNRYSTFLLTDLSIILNDNKI